MLSLLSEFFYTLSTRIFSVPFTRESFSVYTRNIGWITISKFFTIPFSLLTISIVARTLGPEAFGVLSYVLSINVLFAVIANLGVDNIVYKELITHKHRREEILGSAMALKFTTGCIAITLATISLFFLQESFYIKALIFLISLSFITQPLALLGFDFLKDKEAKYTTIAQVATSFISNFFKILTVVVLSSLSYYILVMVFENIIMGIIYMYQMKILKQRSISFIVSKKEVYSLLSLALPLTLFSAFTEIYSRIDQIMLRFYIDQKAVGLYAAATRLTEIWYLIPNILISALFPALAEAISDEKEYTRRVKTLAFTLFGCGLFISLFVVLTSKLLIKIVYGSAFIDASPLLVMYVFSLCGSFVSTLINQDLLLRKKKWQIVLLPVITAILNIGLNLILIPAKGALGAALATVLSYNVIPLLFYIGKTPHIGKHYHRVKSFITKNKTPEQPPIYPLTP